MRVIIGLIFVYTCVLWGYTSMGGYLMVLWQPFEFVIIGGAAIGGYVVANTKPILSHSFQALKDIIRGPKYSKQDIEDLLCLLFLVFKVAKTKGMLALEAHIENPEESVIFTHFEKFAKDQKAMVFLCDYLRLLTMGMDNPYQIDDLMLEELDTMKSEHDEVVEAVQYMADSTPALGIVAAVLGVIKTMGSITEPPEILGKLIAGALVGTFLGVLLSYGMIGPIARIIKNIYHDEAYYFSCMRTGLIAFMNGSAPIIAMEFARKTLPHHVRPKFEDIEKKTYELPDPTKGTGAK